MVDTYSQYSGKKNAPDWGAHPCEAAVSAPSAAACFLRWLIAPLFALAVFSMTVDSAEARRFGGGKSFGSKPSYSTGYKKTAPQKEAAGKQQSSTKEQQAASGKTPPQTRPGGFGGMLGGMLMGGLIGSLLFGGGFGGGIGLLELLLFGVVGYMLFKFIRSRRTAAAGVGGGNPYAYAGNQPAGAPQTGRDDGWASLRSAPARQEDPDKTAEADIPEGFDQTEFLTGAKALFARLQNSWDRRDLSDIRLFTSSELLSQIEHQAAQDPAPGKTDVLMVDARVLELKKEGSETVVTVLYDALLREDQNASQPEQVREVWHLRRDESAQNPEWILEGIQQLEV